MPWWHVDWGQEYFSGLAYKYPGMEFSFVENSEPSLADQVTETYFPISDRYINLIFYCMENEYYIGMDY